MKIIIYKLISLLLLGLAYNNAWAQGVSIDGPTEICPSDLIINSYELIGTDATCDAIDNINWQLDYPVPILYSGTNPVTLTWSTTTASNEATLTVIYDCIDLDDDGNVLGTTRDTATLDITILNINEPIITSPSIVELDCNETAFTIDVSTQPGSEYYSVTQPDCFEYTYDATNSQFNFTTDNAASGEVCITVHHPSCGTSKTECITVQRACEDNLAFSSTSPITNSYHSVNNYITASDVSTTSFSTLEFKAGKAIVLQPGFYGNEVFLAHIGPCSCLPEGETGCSYGRFVQDNPTNMHVAQSKIQKVKMPDNSTTNQNTVLYSTAKAMHNSFSIYPNPSQGAFTVQFQKLPSNTIIQIFDMMGRVRKHITVNKLTQLINASDLENGVYIVVVSGQEHLFKEKIIISK